MNYLKKSLIFLTSFTIFASQAIAKTDQQLLGTLNLSALDIKQKVEAAQWLQNTTVIPTADRIVGYKRKSIVLQNKQGESISELSGSFGSFDHRLAKDGLLLAAVDMKLQQVVVVNHTNTSKGWGAKTALPKQDFKAEAVCFYQDPVENAYVFVVGEEGKGEQWLVANQSILLPEPKLVRHLSLPPLSKFCQVDDQRAKLYVNEENVGVWEYSADPEADLKRTPIAMVKPFGNIQGVAAGMALVGDALLQLDSMHHALHIYQENAGIWSTRNTLVLAGLNSPETVSVREKSDALELLVKDDKGLHTATIAWKSSTPSKVAHIPMVMPDVQTALVPSLGDAADDPAIWVHPTQSSQSRILATDKQGGLLVYDLSGKQLQDLRVGRLNNVDVRKGFKLAGKVVDLAIATNRDHNTLQVFEINPETGFVTALGELESSNKDIYGFCMFKDHRENFYAIANDTDGHFYQYQIEETQQGLKSTLKRAFAVSSQPEGCVADDQTERLYIGEEDVAVWTLDARAEKPATLEKVIGVGGVVKEDIEGMALYQDGKHNYLVFSSQGNSRYVVVDATAPYALRGAFTIGANAQANIDGTSDTDGLDVSAVNFGGVWSKGMLVVQDGRKRMPVGNQNYKYIPWSSISEALNLP